MDFENLRKRALEIREQYNQFNKSQGHTQWGLAEYSQGMVGDIGDFSKLVMAKNGYRNKDNIDEGLKHELADIFWSLIVIADELNIDLGQALLDTMDDLEKRIRSERA